MGQTPKQAEWYRKNRETILTKRRLYREENRKLLAEKQKIYAQENPDIIKSYRTRNKENLAEKKREYDKQYYMENKDKKRNQSREWLAKNRERYNENARKRAKQRRESEPVYKNMNNIRNLIRIAMKKQSVRKNTKTTELLGCTAKQFASHIESLFEPWMNWDNLGVCTGKPKTTWHIDHIIPLSHFDLSDPEQQKVAFHYTNCRPLDSLTNVSEGNRR